MGFVFSGMTGGVLVSPFLAGIVYDKAGYFPVFAMVIAVLVADLLLRVSFIEKKTAARWDESAIQPRTPQNPEEVQSPYESFGSPGTDGRGDGKRAVSGRTTPRRESADEHSPLLQTSLWQSIDPYAQGLPNGHSKIGPHSSQSWPMRNFPSTTTIFTSKRLMTAVLGIFVYMTIVASFDGALAQFVKRTFGFNSTGVGLIFLALTLPALFGTAFGALSDRYGPRNLALSGFAITALGLALSVLITHKSTGQVAGLSVLLVVTGSWDDIP